MTPIWSVDEALDDLAAVGALLDGMPAGSPEERLRAVAGHFEGRYGAARGRQVLTVFVRVCLYLERHDADLRASGLLGAGAPAGPGGATVERAFLAALVEAAAAPAPAAAGEGQEIVAAVPARDVPDDAVEP